MTHPKRRQWWTGSGCARSSLRSMTVALMAIRLRHSMICSASETEPSSGLQSHLAILCAHACSSLRPSTKPLSPQLAKVPDASFEHPLKTRVRARSEVRCPVHVLQTPNTRSTGLYEPQPVGLRLRGAGPWKRQREIFGDALPVRRRPRELSRPLSAILLLSTRPDVRESR